MNISKKWLKEWVYFKVTTNTLVEDLTMGGIEVDTITNLKSLDNIVIGEVVECNRHPNADKLSICKVNVADKDNLQIICGAANVAKGLKVTVAKVGAKLPSGLVIKEAKLRGELSQGMLCSESEIGLTSTSDGIMELGQDAIIGNVINDYLDLDDELLELDITPNRGDCFSVLGIAREVATYYKLELKKPTINIIETIKDIVPTNVIETKACPKYLTRVIKNVNNKLSTPQWLKNKLVKSGQSLHSPVVDITNFVMLELGQPLHAFDLSKVGQLTVRYSKGEKIQLLNQKEAELDNKTLVIADDSKNGEVLAIAGVMGGLKSSVIEQTKDIVLEAAFFTPELIAGCARKYGLHTESSLRFERGVDYKLPQIAIDRASQLIVDILGGDVANINEHITKEYINDNKEINLDKNIIKEILGIDLENSWIEENLQSLGFAISKQAENKYLVTVPSYRFDVNIQEDLAEELARLYGYDKLPVATLSNANNYSKQEDLSVNILNTLVAQGYKELISYSFIDKKNAKKIAINNNKGLIELQNPISGDMSVMRPSLWIGLLNAANKNKKHGFSDNRFFEVGLCFEGIEKQQQIKKIAGLITGKYYKTTWRNENKEVDFFDIKEITEKILKISKKNYHFTEVEHQFLQLGQTAEVFLDNKSIGYVGKLSPTIEKEFSLNSCYLFELDFNSLLNKNTYSYKIFSNYQTSKRDLAIVINNDITTLDCLESINYLQQELLVNVELFDIYQGDNIDKDKKSLAFSLSYQAMDRTLTDEEIEQQVQDVFNILNKKFAAIRR